MFHVMQNIPKGPSERDRETLDEAIEAARELYHQEHRDYLIKDTNTGQIVYNTRNDEALGDQDVIYTTEATSGALKQIPYQGHLSHRAADAAKKLLSEGYEVHIIVSLEGVKQ